MEIEKLLAEQYNTDFPERKYDDKDEMSQEDKQFLQSVQKTTTFENGHYCVGLPLKNEKVKMPNNRCVAEQRIKCLQRKLQKNPEFFEDYKSFMDTIIEKGYAVQVPTHQVNRDDNRVFYIPHHGVYHPKKKKLRVVFDCTASFRDRSLNSELLQGPDMTNTLVGVLLRFREELVASMADIESMFYQVKVPEHDADLLRFLWWPNGKLTEPTEEFRMTVHLFGATSSPSVASYALKRTAEDHRDVASPEAVQTVLRNFYVDDCLKSVATEDDAVTLARDLQALCASGGFTLTKWMSNSRKVLLSIPEAHRASEVRDLDLQHDALPVKRTLGVQWDTETDNFTYRMMLQDKPMTRRGILSVVNSIYDPLGFLAPVILPAKLLLKELCKEQHGWDKDIGVKHAKDWKIWIEDVTHLSNFHVNRCLKSLDFGCTASAQLHHFSDASEYAYGTLDRKEGSLLNDPEVKNKVTVNTIKVCEDMEPMNELINYHSSWHELKRSVAWILKVKETLWKLKEERKELSRAISQTEKDPDKQKLKLEQHMKKVKGTIGKKSLTLDDLVTAESEIIQFSQKQQFGEDIKILQKGRQLGRSSQLFKLDPVLQDSTLRVGGRLNKSAMPENAKHPAILSKHSGVVTLILRDIHQRTGHCGRSYVLAQLRRKYWIPQANSAIRKIISKCTTCRRINGKVGEQKMACLPEDRLLPDKPPFTNTGVDFFGPFNVKRGRGTVKRYGVMFTCLTLRAVHIEVADSLDTDSCINAIRRFISRRGQVTIMRSDNGTNFVSSERELREAIQLDNGKIERDLQPKGIKWIFNSPAASHQGGVWERQIRTNKQRMMIAYTQSCEVESIINGRPLTSVSDDVNDVEPLTPNHLLLLRCQPSMPPGIFSKDDTHTRRRWKQVQYLVDLFWTRWTREYLPLLQERQKWLKPRRNFTTGDVVLLVDSSSPRNSWLMGKVVETLPDASGTVRRVKIKTRTSTLERPVNKLCLLEEAISEE
ncbi:hypothetical protein N1851_024662 [Merluccius polli]|uniref:Integrase catalytic domain-containing protein n=2 Tax=Merluccius polli TaxID=89951 RepID=A0AA47NVF8_MERPO|nr:hypothetical protein N1851_024662 [Merluccius polli]